MTELAGKTDK